MENNYNYTPLTLLFSPNCLKCAIVNLKYAKKCSSGPIILPAASLGLSAGDDARSLGFWGTCSGKEDDTPSSVGQGLWAFQADGLL